MHDRKQGRKASRAARAVTTEALARKLPQPGSKAGITSLLSIMEYIISSLLAESE
jgi:hypothetical protein